MKKCSLILILALILSLSACSHKTSTESNAELTKLQNAYEALSSNFAQLNNDYETTKSCLTDEKKEYDKLKSDYEQYKEKMKPYESLSEEEAKVKELEDKKKLEKEDAKKRAKEDAKQKQVENERKAGYDTGITFDQIARTPEQYKEKKVKFKGTVLQVMEQANDVELRLSVSDDSSKVIYCYYDPSITPSRVLENDTITIYGISNGLLTYESTAGTNVTVPSVLVEKIDLKN